MSIDSAVGEQVADDLSRRPACSEGADCRVEQDGPFGRRQCGPRVRQPRVDTLGGRIGVVGQEGVWNRVGSCESVPFFPAPDRSTTLSRQLSRGLTAGDFELTDRGRRQQIADDLGALLRTVDRIRDALGFAPDASDDVDERSRYRLAGATADVLENVAASIVRSTYSRRALVYVSEGMTYRRDAALYANPLQPPIEILHRRHVFDQIQEALERLRKAGVPVYAFDLRAIPDCNAVRGRCAIPPYGNIRAQQQMLRQFAENTGGLAFVNQSDTLRAVRQIVADNNAYYLIGYYPSPLRRDGAFHDVRVSVRRPGLHIRARAGYVAATAGLTGATSDNLLNELLGASAMASEIQLDASAGVFQPMAPCWRLSRSN